MNGIWYLHIATAFMDELIVNVFPMYDVKVAIALKINGIRIFDVPASVIVSKSDNFITKEKPYFLSSGGGLC